MNGAAGTLQFILDIELLTHADYFVGTTNSGLPHVVDVLRFAVYNKDRATFVDASFRHQDWFSRMRRFWNAKEGVRRLLHERAPSRGGVGMGQREGLLQLRSRKRRGMLAAKSWRP